jgi:hypothetical protein
LQDDRAICTLLATTSPPPTAQAAHRSTTMQPLVFLDLNHLSTAYSFLDECADEEPRGFGVDLLPAYVERRHGRFQIPLETEENMERQATSLEDQIIAHLDGEIEEEQDLTIADEEAPYAACEGEAEDVEAAAIRAAVAPVTPALAPLVATLEAGRDLFEVFPEHHGMGRVARLPRAAKALRSGETIRR